MDREFDNTVKTGAKLFGGIFGAVGTIWLAWALFCCVLSGTVLCGVGYAIYWGLSLAERAVEVHERGEVASDPETPASRH